ncbi:hypothetical protein D3C81_2275750 [compost metagenome]
MIVANLDSFGELEFLTYLAPLLMRPTMIMINTMTMKIGTSVNKKSNPPPKELNPISI